MSSERESLRTSRICDDGYACLAPDCSCKGKLDPRIFRRWFYRRLVRRSLFGREFILELRWRRV